MDGVAAMPAWVWVLVVVAVTAGVLSVYTFRYRTIPGALWLTAMNLVVCVYTGTYILLATVIRAPATLAFLEHLQLALGTLAVACWFLFVLTYTGRAELLGRRGHLAVITVLASVFVLNVTGPIHGLVFSEVFVDLSGDVPIVDTDSNVIHVVQLLALFSLSPIGLVFLHRSLSEHDELFSEQAFALLLGSVSPYVAAGIDVMQLEPDPAMPLLPLGFGAMSVALTYAAARHRLFEFVPATRRIGEARALQQLDDGVVIVSTDGTVLQINESACQLLDCDRAQCLGEPLANLHETGDGGPTDVPETIDRLGRTLQTSRSAVEGPTGDVMGYAVVYRDVTGKRRRQQRITVLNRLLRHNLRNELSLVEGHVTQLAEIEDSEQRQQRVDEIEAVIEGIVDLSQQAHAVERHLSVADRAIERVAIGDLVDRIVERTARNYPSAEIVSDVPPDLAVSTYPHQLEVVLENLVENGLQHNDSSERRLGITATRDSDGVAIVIADDGPGIPDHEIEAIESGESSQLYHGSGLGLWLVSWVVAVLGGDLDFEVTDSGTTVHVWVPNLGEQ
ncbi:histidine kinase N-terminal 7TM domain-containing protein [Natranaeroarchaeum sulfidigenes]|uniref:histidine kinase n=1 Tax=Natranaeroarchaeum sulfidigenes TaxID=2784880 RepID=A0A897MIU4_9EURY|nr:histidine kinase N-terminal 7TM domain-containing protein [Natranaeroarchaeum sulfidigenes]QSG02040.1 Signal transduction histidine kinase, contains PAS domain [Natranaeroarchaeum sulfidigenes]